MTVTPAQTAAAKLLMANGSSMQDAAVYLGVRSSDLDYALWAHIGTPIHELLAMRQEKKRHPRPDFD